AEKWRDGEVIATLTGTKKGGLGEPRRFALIRTGENWLIHLMNPADTKKPAQNKAPRRKIRPEKSSSTAKPVAPMLATAGKAFDIDDEDDWAFEMKWDGYRAVAVCDGTDVALFSRTGKDMTDTYPEVADALAAHDLNDTVLDGEVVALGPDGAPSFSRLQQGTRPIQYLLFDVLSHDGEALKNASYLERRDVLRDLDLDDKKTLRVPLAFDGSLEDAVASSQELGLEGVVAKRRDSRYRSGARSSSWIKIKNQRMQEAVIVGWRPGKGNRSGNVGSLLLAMPDGDGWRYIGRVGTGFTDRVVRDLTERLKAIERKTAPLEVPRDVAREARWVSPKLVGEVTYSEWTGDGHLRHPVWRGLRPDKKPADVRPE
ncbi:MAG: non-homologous end-joining DNA ligase, partial [Aeromicrobium sp.]